MKKPHKNSVKVKMVRLEDVRRILEEVEEDIPIGALELYLKDYGVRIHELWMTVGKKS